MNDRLQNEFIAAAALAPSGQRMYALIAMVAEHCAAICDIEAEGDKRINSGASHASKTIRAAFIGRPELNMVKPVAQAAAMYAFWRPIEAEVVAFQPKAA